MKRNLLLIFAVSIILSGCGSSKKQLEKGNYDNAIASAVKQREEMLMMKTDPYTSKILCYC